MATRTRHDAQRAHRVHVGIQIGKRPLHLAQLIVPRCVTAGERPDLEDIVFLDVGKILLPGGGHVHKELLIELVIEVADEGSLRPLVLFALVPQHGADAVREPGSHNPVVQGGID